MAERATGTLELRVTGVNAALTGTARLRAHPTRSTNWMALEVPAVQPDSLDLGTEMFMPNWRLLGVTDESGDAVQVVVPTVDPGAQLAFRPDRRLVLVRWPEPLVAGAARTLEVRWRQDLPFGIPERLVSLVVASGTSTPLVPALPRLAGDGTPFPYTLTTWAPKGVVVASSGTPAPDAAGPLGLGTRSQGLAGPDAVIAAGRWGLARAGHVSVYTDGANRAMVDAVAAITAPLQRWSGVTLGEARFLTLPRSWRPPAAVGGEGVAGLRRAIDPADFQMPREGPPTDLPEYATVLGAEGLAAAAWAGRGGPTLAGHDWLWALGRAFALDVLQPRDADRWREWLQQCARPRDGMRPALSPEVAATTAWRETATRCAGPMLVGPMLDDRIGPVEARLARREVLEGGPVGLATLRAAVLARAPDAGPWVDRWLAAGNPVRLTLRWSATRTTAGVTVTGVVLADSALADAPVRVRLHRGTLHHDLIVHGAGKEIPFTVEAPFVPLRLEVDPDHRILRDPHVGK